MLPFRGSRIFLLLKLFVVSMLIFISQKPLFMYYNRAVYSSLSITDYLAVMWHGLSLDMTVTAYTLVIPFLVLLLSFFLRLRLRTILKSYYALVMFVVVLIFVADTVMYSFWHFKLDTTIFLYTDKPADAIASVSTLFIVGCTLAFLFFYAISLDNIYKVIPEENEYPRENRWWSLLMLLLAPVLFLMIRGGVGDGTANVTKSYFSDNQFLNHSAVNSTFNMLYSVAHQQDFSKEFNYYNNEQEYHSLLKGIFNTESVSSEKLINNHRPNILLIVWEGCGGTIAGCAGADTDATPNLDKLAKEGTYFSNCHANSFRTDRGLVSINCGWLGFPTASLMKIPEKCESLPGIAKTLKKNGYTTDFWYGGDISFTNMGGFMLQNGFQKTTSDKNFTSSERSSNWGVPDEQMFSRVIDDIAKRKDGKPWFTEVMTLSSHEPWDVPYKRLSNKIHNSFAYSDHCLGMFMDKFKKMPEWKNTLVIIVPDHGVLSDPKLSMSDYNVVHIPLVFTGGAIINSKNIDVLMNQSDIAATLLGQLGIPHNDFAFSRDVLSKSYSMPTAIYSSKVEMTFYDTKGYTTIDLSSDRKTFNKGKADNERIKRGKAVLQKLYDSAAKL